MRYYSLIIAVTLVGCSSTPKGTETTAPTESAKTETEPDNRHSRFRTFLKPWNTVFARTRDERFQLVSNADGWRVHPLDVDKLYISDRVTGESYPIPFDKSCSFPTPGLTTFHVVCDQELRVYSAATGQLKSTKKFKEYVVPGTPVQLDDSGENYTIGNRDKTKLNAPRTGSPALIEGPNSTEIVLADFGYSHRAYGWKPDPNGGYLIDGEAGWLRLDEQGNMRTPKWQEGVRHVVAEDDGSITVTAWNGLVRRWDATAKKASTVEVDSKFLHGLVRRVDQGVLFLSKEYVSKLNRRGVPSPQYEHGRFALLRTAQGDKTIELPEPVEDAFVYEDGSITYVTPDRVVWWDPVNKTELHSIEFADSVLVRGISHSGGYLVVNPFIKRTNLVRVFDLRARKSVFTAPSGECEINTNDTVMACADGVTVSYKSLPNLDTIHSDRFRHFPDFVDSTGRAALISCRSPDGCGGLQVKGAPLRTAGVGPDAHVDGWLGFTHNDEVIVKSGTDIWVEPVVAIDVPEETRPNHRPPGALAAFRVPGFAPHHGIVGEVFKSRNVLDSRFAKTWELPVDYRTHQYLGRYIAGLSFKNNHARAEPLAHVEAGTVTLYDVKTGEIVRTFTLPLAPFESQEVRLSQDATRVLFTAMQQFAVLDVDGTVFAKHPGRLIYHDANFDERVVENGPELLWFKGTTQTKTTALPLGGKVVGPFWVSKAGEGKFKIINLQDGTESGFEETSSDLKDLTSDGTSIYRKVKSRIYVGYRMVYPTSGAELRWRSTLPDANNEYIGNASAMESKLEGLEFFPGGVRTKMHVVKGAAPFSQFEGTVRLTGSGQYETTGLQAPPLWVTPVPGHDALYMASIDGQVRLWDFEAASSEVVQVPYEFAIGGVAVSPNGTVAFRALKYDDMRYRAFWSDDARVLIIKPDGTRKEVALDHIAQSAVFRDDNTLLVRSTDKVITYDLRKDTMTTKATGLLISLSDDGNYGLRRVDPHQADATQGIRIGGGVYDLRTGQDGPFRLGDDCTFSVGGRYYGCAFATDKGIRFSVLSARNNRTVSTGFGDVKPEHISQDGRRAMDVSYYHPVSNVEYIAGYPKRWAKRGVVWLGYMHSGARIATDGEYLWLE